MLFLNSVRMAPGVRSVVAVACGLTLSGAGMAQVKEAQESVEPVVVTATRFQQSAQTAAANVTVITRDDIRVMPAQSVPDILKMVAGVDVRPSYGALGIDTTVDLGGFGTTATSNTLVLVDGQRVNPIDMGSIIWSSIPKDGIERIEVIRGSGSVLYGNGASGGVINIITGKSQRSPLTMSASLGSFGYKDANVHAAAQNDLGYVNATLHHADEDGYRKNNKQGQDSISGRGGLYLEGAGQAFADYTVYHEANGLPGGLDSTAYAQDPRRAQTPNDFQSRNGYRIRPGVTYRLADQLELDAEIAVEHQELKSNYVYYSSSSDRIRDTQSFTPRVRWRHGLGSLSSETVVGLDIYDGTLSSVNVGYANQGGGQSSSAVYAQNITKLTSDLSLTLADRVQRMRQNAWQDATSGPYGSPAMSGSGSNTQHAYDVGVAYARADWHVYGKTGTTFRFANIDELFGYDTTTYSPVFAGNLRPQHGTINELGGALTLGQVKLSGSVYQLDLTDEIGYDGAQSANVNFDPTRRQGIDTELNWKANERWAVKLAYSYVDAQFTSGVYAGKALPLVSRDKASVQAIWNGANWGSYTAMVRYVGNSHYDGDLANEGGTLGGYTTVDLQGAWDVRPWRITVKLLNAFDRKYAPSAVYAAATSYSTAKYAYYPADGRALFVSAGYQF